jgi:hypothetical protein
MHTTKFWLNLDVKLDEKFRKVVLVFTTESDWIRNNTRFEYPLVLLQIVFDKKDQDHDFLSAKQLELLS